MRLIGAFFLTLFSLSLLFIIPVQAQFERANCFGLPEVDWRESRSQSFVFLYPAEQEEFGSLLAGVYGETLDTEYNRFEALFDASLAVPVTIRVYPTEDHYYCLNAQPPEILPGVSHSQIGTREIALVAENISGSASDWLGSSLNIFRYELAIMFAKQVSGEKAPPGLVVAVGHYGQDPMQTIGALQLPSPGWSEPGKDWRGLWEDANTRFDLERKLQVTSTVAFLVDTYGWESLVRFLNHLQTSTSYTLSLEQIYGEDAAALQDDWRQFYPAYFQGGWRSNVIYNYDLEPYRELLEAGEYGEAHKGLLKAVAFLQKINQTEKLNEAQTLLTWARQGREATVQFSQSRQALKDGDYQRSIDLVDQAQQDFTSIGHYYRMDELNAYRAQVQEILDLHKELVRLKDAVESSQVRIHLAGQTIAIGQRLRELGDVQGHQQVLEIAQSIERQQRYLQIVLSVLFAVVVIALLGYRIWLLKRKPAPEAQL